MRKIIIMSFFFVAVCSILSAQVFITTNIQYETAYKLESELSPANWDTKLGYKLVSYWFPKDRKLGVISYVGGKFLPTSYGLINGNKVTDCLVDFSPYIGIGIGFKYDITEKMKIHIGTAGSTDIQIFHTKNEDTFGTMQQNDCTVTFGVTNDISFKYIIVRNVYIDCGATIGLWFAQHIYRKVVYDNRMPELENKWRSGYFKFSFTPFIGLGIRLPL